MNKRNLAIDIFRGLTMALMVFVNDSWTVHDAPSWMIHFDTWADGMSLADIVFPMFLFAMGMSVPYALENRFSKGYSLGSTLGHILKRTLALLLMGVFINNSEAGMAGNKGVYWLLMLLGFFLVWNQYPKDFKAAKWLQGAGAVLLGLLAITFRRADGGLFQAGWWGILGLIGWAYLFTSCSYLLFREKKWVLALLWGVLCLVNLSVTPMREGGAWIGKNFVADLAEALHLGNGSCALMALAGTLTVLCEGRLKSARVGIGLAAAAVLAVMGLCFHQDWIISKNIGTLPWVLFVSAISVAFYTLLRWLEHKGWTAWATPLKPAGTATLTVYMIPYLFYSFWVFLSPQIPAWLCGYAGALKCALFSALCIFLAWALGKIHIKLKI